MKTSSNIMDGFSDHFSKPASLREPFDAFLPCLPVQFWHCYLSWAMTFPAFRSHPSGKSYHILRFLPGCYILCLRRAIRNLMFWFSCSRPLRITFTLTWPLLGTCWLSLASPLGYSSFQTLSGTAHLDWVTL